MNRHTVLAPVVLALGLLASACGGNSATDGSTVKSSGAPFCGQATANTRVCLSADGETLTLSNPVGIRTMYATSYDSTFWSGGTDYVATGDLSFVAGFGYTTIKLTYQDGYGHLAFTGTTNGVSAQWFNWPGTTNASSFVMEQSYQVPCCKH